MEIVITSVFIVVTTFLVAGYMTQWSIDFLKEFFKK